MIGSNTEHGKEAGAGVALPGLNFILRAVLKGREIQCSINRIIDCDVDAGWLRVVGDGAWRQPDYGGQAI